MIVSLNEHKPSLFEPQKPQLSRINALKTQPFTIKLQVNNFKLLNLIPTFSTNTKHYNLTINVNSKPSSRLALFLSLE